MTTYNTMVTNNPSTDMKIVSMLKIDDNRYFVATAQQIYIITDTGLPGSNSTIKPLELKEIV